MTKGKQRKAMVKKTIDRQLSRGKMNYIKNSTTYICASEG
jgi:hypothetical protein